MHPGELTPAPGATKREKRVGHGPGSGRGKTSTRGQKGQKARSGGAKGSRFEGGQTPFVMRVPKRGFHPWSRRSWAVVNLQALERFDATQTITPELLKAAGLIRRNSRAVKILGDGELKVALTIHAHRFSQSALEKIQRAGGTAEVIQARP